MASAKSNALLDHLEDTVPTQGGYIIDWHIPDIFPRSWIDLVVVLRADTAVLYDRLAARGYSESKLQENLDAEIMQVVLEDVKDAFEEEDDEDDSNPNAENGTSRDRDDEAIPGEQVDSALRRRRMVVVFPSNTDDDMERNLECLQMWIMARIALEREDRRSEGDKEEGVTP
ncbi:MAG: factor activating pos9 [Lichina confinis]|nr:MAG: factor activating pos9 [Lichina confinis]